MVRALLADCYPSVSSMSVYPHGLWYLTSRLQHTTQPLPHSVCGKLHRCPGIHQSYENCLRAEIWPNIQWRLSQGGPTMRVFSSHLDFTFFLQKIWLKKKIFWFSVVWSMGIIFIFIFLFFWARSRLLLIVFYNDRKEGNYCHENWSVWIYFDLSLDLPQRL